MQSLDWQIFIASMAKKTNADFIVIRCMCSEETLRRRLIERGEERDKWKLDHWEEFLKREPIVIPIPFKYIDIDTEHNILENVNHVLRYVVQQSS